MVSKGALLRQAHERKMASLKQSERPYPQPGPKAPQKGRLPRAPPVSSNRSTQDFVKASAKGKIRGKGKQPALPPPQDPPKNPISLTEYARKQSVPDKPPKIVKKPTKPKVKPKARALTANSRGPRDVSVIKARLYITLLETMQKLMKVTTDDVDTFSGAMEALDTPLRSLKAVKVTRETGEGTLLSVESADDSLDFQAGRLSGEGDELSSGDGDDVLADLEKLVDLEEASDGHVSGGSEALESEESEEE